MGKQREEEGRRRRRGDASGNRAVARWRRLRQGRGGAAAYGGRMVGERMGMMWRGREWRRCECNERELVVIMRLG